MKKKKNPSNFANNLNIQPTLSALPDGFQWKYAAFSQVVLLEDYTIFSG